MDAWRTIIPMLMPRGLSNRSSSAYLRRWRLWTCTRHASSGGTGPRGHIPFPTHPRPTPHQIFHLPHGATAAEIKSRCEFTDYFGNCRGNVPHPNGMPCGSSDFFPSP
ncbi:uncharacterized protein EI90DRAFT_3062388 [Cantharellus anzutake]|uniref:uncharacterized protein n=1 Tax=Cantharellus anzutake TaxID=1750568 RepID=UPI001903D378|nr:uncharacterized protein EI90DRAFT_3062388 [Cantharellus anzutake]KAF8329366.1 hypothetical protein EI90DRAFT_3062388 [Cantharellus anzutake]